jgi:hypothetical protein
MQFFEDKDTRPLLTYCTKSAGNGSEEPSLFACMSPALQKTANYIETLGNEDVVFNESVFETSEVLGSECLNLNLFDAHLRDLFPTVDLRTVLFVSYNHVHTARMRQKNLGTLDSSASSHSCKVVYFCKQRNTSITSASMIFDSSIVLFGVIAPAAINSTISMMHDLWRPLFDINRSAWGSLDFERMQDFHQAKQTVTDILLQSIRESANEVQLAFPDAALDIDHVPLHRDAISMELQRILIVMVNSWSDAIDSAIRNNDAFFQECSLPPAEEIEYWTDRYNSLGVIAEQLKVRERRHCAALVGILESKAAQAAVKRFRHAEKALADNLTEALDTKSHLTPLQRLAVTVQRSSITDLEANIPELMNCIASLALKCRRYGPGHPISLFLGKFSYTIERCVLVHLRGDFVSTSVMFWSRADQEIMQLLIQCIACIDRYTAAVQACRLEIHAQQVALNSQNYSAASRAPLQASIQEDVVCQNLLKLKRILIDLQTALQWQNLFASCVQLHAVSSLGPSFDAFQNAVSNLKSIDLVDLFDLRSHQLESVMFGMQLAKHSLCEACLSYINSQLEMQDTVNKKIDILDLHRDILEQAGPTAITMVAQHSLAIVQVSVALLLCHYVLP